MGYLRTLHFRNFFIQFIYLCSPPPLEIQAPIFCAIVSTGDQPGFDFILKKYTETSTSDHPALKTRLLNGLACAVDTDLLQKLLEMTIFDSTTIEVGHRLGLIQRIAANSRGRLLIVSFLNEYLPQIIDIIGNGDVYIVQPILDSLSQYLSTQKGLDEVKSKNFEKYYLFLCKNGQDFYSLST
jgi:hypothetical protein